MRGRAVHACAGRASRRTRDRPGLRHDRRGRRDGAATEHAGTRRLLLRLRLPAAFADNPAGTLTRRCPTSRPCATGWTPSGYLADEGLATALFLAVRMGQPLLLEGEPGVGKTEAAKALAATLDTPLLRLQCYEGLTAAEALYEWNYPRQLLAIRLAEARGETLAEADLFGARLPAAPAAARGRSTTPDRARRCCSSTRSTGPTTSSRRSCSSCSPRAAVTDPGAGHPAGGAAAGRRAHLEPHPRPARRAASAAASTTGSATRTRAGRRRSSVGACRAADEPLAAAGRRGRSAGCAGSSSPSRRASPRRSAGPPLCTCSGDHTGRRGGRAHARRGAQVRRGPRRRPRRGPGDAARRWLSRPPATCRVAARFGGAAARPRACRRAGAHRAVRPRGHPGPTRRPGRSSTGARRPRWSPTPASSPVLDRVFARSSAALTDPADRRGDPNAPAAGHPTADPRRPRRPAAPAARTRPSAGASPGAEPRRARRRRSSAPALAAAAERLAGRDFADARPPRSWPLLARR